MGGAQTDPPPDAGTARQGVNRYVKNHRRMSMKTAMIEKVVPVRKTLTRTASQARSPVLRSIPRDETAAAAETQVAEIERTFSVRWEW